MFSLNQRETANSDFLFLDIGPEDLQEAWQQSQKQSNAIARHNAYLNYVCLKNFLNWFAEESECEISVWPSFKRLANIWEIVNGSAIQLGQNRLVLIPNDDAEVEKLCVPQEWVDIPNWVADYYLAVSVVLDGDEDECFLKVWGFTTHRQLRNNGRYNESDRTYNLPIKYLTASLNVMQVTFGLNVQQQVPQLPSLSHAEATRLLEILGDPSLYSPRLRVDVPFEKWAALLDNDEWRQKLYDRRMGRLVEVASAAPVKNLGKWFQGIFEAGWQSLDTLINTESSNLAFGFRKRDRKREETKVSVEGIKLIDLGMQLGNQSVALLIGLTPESGEKVGIRVQLHPARGQIYLPPNIKLILLSQSGQVIHELQSRLQDNFIQLKRFTCPMGKGFKIQVAMEEMSITEDFAIEAFGNDNYE
ncbi:DUF1822 family protein [Planktothrix sp. FACHB-1355]|uniref:DUF1822 family protein n=1 Tax=Aerosakkonema funiforme FACHB-1375 TaxID=2949571 RepID=A0A926ZI31_9CYAN|nr:MULTISPECIES: DUF1822 family protein [Oscillatoriales]MBD2183695.1 DUF1822 family protein [Aerosakkonema funiforme FACHB-1375]MBD3559441.1 DUF1822 family protein [Planktothrix sp. FACHB-1355]